MNAWAPLPVTDSSGRALADALSKALEARQPHLLLVLRLSDRPDAAVPERVRVARSLLEETARPGGQVLTLGNGDIAALMRRPRGGQEAISAGLTSRLARLFALPESALNRMLACWSLDGMPGAALGYVRERLMDLAQDGSFGVKALVNPWDCLERQVAIRLPGPRETPQITILHHALSPAPALLRRAAEGEDSFLLRYLRDRVAAALLPGTDPADPAPVLARLSATAPVHLAFGPASASSPEVVRLLHRGATHGFRLGFDIAIEDFAAAPEAIGQILPLARSAGIPLAVAGVSADHLALMAPEVIGADLIKLEASSALLAQAARVRALRDSVGSARLLLAGANTEALVRWGMDQGIRRFQGAHVDAMLAAARLLACPYAADCSLGQCADRGRSVSDAGQHGCRDRKRLDRAG